MSFSKQDARYEAKPLDLSEYSAVDMMADLGLHRRVSLPLQGRTTVIPPPPPDIHKRGPMLARIVERDAEIQTAWGSVFDPALVEGRDDGLGTGQMHRSGQNFIPDEVRQRSPPRLRRARSAEGSGIGGRFELGRRPGKAPHPRQLPEPSQALRKVRERSGARSPDELDPDGDILAELRVESKLRMAKYKSIRPVARIVSHHIAGNPPVAPRAPSRAISMLSFHSSRIVPSNPLVSQWGAGNKLATASAGYNYAKDLDAKKAGKASTEPALQDRTLNKVNNAAPKDSCSFVAHVPHRLAPKTAHSNTKPVPFPTSSPTGSTIPFRQIPFPDTTQFFSPIANGAWAGDKPFDTESGQKLTDVTKNVDNTPKTGNDTKPAAILNAIHNPALEQKKLDTEKPFIDLPTIDQNGTLTGAVRPREPLDEIFVMDSIEDSYVSSEFDHPLASDSSIFSAARSIHDQESLYLSEGSGHTEEDDLSELINDLQTISKAVQELKIKYLDYEGFEATLTSRLGEIRRLQKDMLSEIDAEEESMMKLKESISALRIKRVAVAGALGGKEIEGEAKKKQAEAAMEAEFKAMIDEHEALIKEHESGAEGVTMADIEEEEESSAETMADIEEEEEESSAETMADIEEEEEESSAETMADIKEEEEEFSTETVPNTEVENKPPDTEEKESTAEESSAENEGIEQERIEEARLNNNRIQQEFASSLERAHAEKSNLESKTFQEQTRKLATAHIELEHFKGEVVEIGKVGQQTLFTAETIRREVEKDCLSAEPQEEDSLLQEAIDKNEFDLKLGKVENDFRRECAEADQAAALLFEGRTISAEKAEKEHLEMTRSGIPEIQSKKDQLEKARTEKLERESHGNARIEADNHRTRAERIRREEGELVREHLEKVRRQEERFKAERAEIRRVQGEGLQAERDEKTRLEAKAEKALFRERGEVASLERRTGGIRIEKRVVSNRFPAVEQPATGPIRQVVFEQRMPSVVPEPTTRPSSSGLPEITVTDKSLFPYTLDLDLRPMYGPHALQVNIGQFDRPQSAILKRCGEVLSSLHHKELSDMPDFKNFLDKCDKRHARRMARACGSPTRG